MSRTDHKSWQELECWIVFAVAGLVVMIIGRQAGSTVNWDGLSALAHAHDVLFKDGSFNIAVLGFVEPPAPVLCYIPLVALTHLLGNVELASGLFGALLLATAALLTARLLVRLELPAYVRIVLLGVLILHPLTLSYAALGSPVILLVVCALGMMKSLMSWGEDGALRDLIGCSLYAALAVLTRYEMVFVVLAAAGYIAARSYRGSDPWQRMEGALIIFALPVAYFGGLWIGANAVIMADAWYFLKHTFGGPEVFSANIFTRVVILPLITFPLIYPLIYHEVTPPGGKKGPAAVSLLVVAAMIPPVLMPEGYASLGGGKIWQALATLTVITLAGAIILAATFFSRYAPGHPGPKKPLSGTAIVAVLSLGLLAVVRLSGFAPPTTCMDAFHGDVAFGQDASDERKMGAFVRSYLADPDNTDNHAVIVGWPGFAVAFFARSDQGRRTAVYPESRVYPEAVESLKPGDLLVILEDAGAWRATIAPMSMTKTGGDFGSWQPYQIRRYYWLRP